MLSLRFILLHYSILHSISNLLKKRAIPQIENEVQEASICENISVSPTSRINKKPPSRFNAC